MNELVQDLGSLEEADQMPRAAPVPIVASNVDERSIAKMVASFLPFTNIAHPSFLRRAFAVWGHFFVANFIVSIPFTNLYFVC